MIMTTDTTQPRGEPCAACAAGNRRGRQPAHAGPDPAQLLERFAVEVYLIDAGTLEVLHLNTAAQRNLGYSPAELRGASLLRLTTHRVADEFRTQTAALQTDPGIEEVVLTCSMRRRDGSHYPVEMRLRRETHHGRAAYVGFAHVAPQRQFALERLDSVLQGASLGFWDWDLARGDFSVDRRWLEILGYRPGDIDVSLDTAPLLVHESDRACVHAAFHELVERGESFSLEFRCLHRQGRTVWVRSSGGVVRQDPATGRSLRACGTTQDITREKVAAVEREEYFKFFNLTTDLMMIGHLDGSIIRANPATLEVMGYTEEELRALPIASWVHPDDRETTREELARQTRSGWTTDFENRCIRKDGSHRWLSWRASYDPESGLSYATARDITEAKELQLALQQQQELFRSLVENTADIICHFDRDHRHTYVSPSATRRWPAAERQFIGRTRREVGFPAELCDKWDAAMERVFRTGQPQSLSYEVTYRNRTACVDWHAFPAAIENGEVQSLFTIARDITHYARTEEELRKVQRLQSIGLLAGGIAHDFNNILTSLFGYLELISEQLSDGHPGLGHLRQVDLAFGRATQLTGQLLSFARGEQPVKQDIRLDTLVREVAEFDLSGSQVRLVCDVAPGLWTIRADKGQLNQVFSNLAINARQAMPNGGNLYVSLENAQVAAGQIGRLPQGRYIECRIRDEGSGIDPGAVERIFDPYYSTKPEGSGLGLSTVYSIVQRHGGGITVESRPGAGTVFTLHLPATDEADDTRSPAACGQTTATADRGAGRILVMDDEEMICALCADFLGRQGYDVTTVHDGDAAIRAHAQALEDGNRFDCVILDLTIPGGVGGREALSRMLETDPAVNSILASGYAADTVLADYARYGAKGCIAKPFRLATLRTELDRVLGSH